MECLWLRVKDTDFDRNQILVRDGKGAKARVTVLPESVAYDSQEKVLIYLSKSTLRSHRVFLAADSPQLNPLSLFSSKNLTG